MDAWTFASWADRPAASAAQRGIDCLIDVALVRLPIVLDWNAVNPEGDYEIVYIDEQCKNLLLAHIISYLNLLITYHRGCDE